MPIATQQEQSQYVDSGAERIARKLRHIMQMTAAYAKENPGTAGAVLGGLGGAGVGYLSDSSLKGATMGALGGAALGGIVGKSLPHTPGELAEQAEGPDTGLPLPQKATIGVAGAATVPPLAYAIRKKLATGTPQTVDEISKLRLLLGNPAHVDALLAKIKTL
jgi:hypothetical protein